MKTYSIIFVAIIANIFTICYAASNLDKWYNQALCWAAGFSIFVAVMYTIVKSVKDHFKH